ncbi:MAG: Ku protein [Dehalococcoidia bacterium]|nr:MAG: Ku protein [Dehalococcoidia bacterium]
MPRAIWRGAISFGMVSIPVKLYSATDSKDISFRQLAKEDLQPIKYLRFSPTLDREVPFDEITKGYEYSKEQYVILDDSDFENLPVPSKHVITITSFVDGSEIDPVYYEKAYQLDPDEIGVKAYALLLKVLEERNVVALGKLALRQKEQLVCLRPSGGHLMVEVLYYPDEVRPYEGTDVSDVAVSEQEMTIARALVDMMHEPFDASKYQDEYRGTLMAMIQAKLEGGEVVTAEEPVPAPTVDLMAALRASIAATQSRKAAAAPEAAASTEAPSKGAGEPVAAGASRTRAKKAEAAPAVEAPAKPARARKKSA